MDEQRDPQLWKEAKARAGFKAHLAVYIIVNGMLWFSWLAVRGVNTYCWPIWPTIGWGIGLIFNFFAVYIFSNSAEKEYEKLKRKQE